MATFKQARLDYFSYVEGIVASEEAAVSNWLRSWAGVAEDQVITTEAAQRASREVERRIVAQSIGADLAANCELLEVEGGETGPETSDGGLWSDDGGSVSASGGSGFSQGGSGGVETPATRKQRSSIPAFAVEKEGRRERIKGFIARTTNSLSSSLPSSSHATGAPPSPSPFNKSTITSSTPHDVAQPAGLAVPPLSTKQQLASQARKKEGFLYGSSKPVGHTTSGDGGGSWHKYVLAWWFGASANWPLLTGFGQVRPRQLDPFREKKLILLLAVLSEGQLIEFSDWKTSLTARNATNLHHATARVSRFVGPFSGPHSFPTNPSFRNTDRRFCFEVITPSTRRIYQGLSDEDVASWIAAISKSIESLINGSAPFLLPRDVSADFAFVQNEHRPPL